MNIYRICKESITVDGETWVEQALVVHENRYTRAEFHKICEECLLNHTCDIDNELEDNLMKYYGFKIATEKASFYYV